MPSTNHKYNKGAGAVACAFVVYLLFPSLLGAAKPPAKKFGDEYVGSETCQTCHEDIYNNLLKSAHTVVETTNADGWKGHACESCHGPGAEHAGSADPTKILDPAKLTAERTDKICLGCHQNTAKHSDRIESSHMKDTVSCVACHTVHGNGPQGLVARGAPAVNALCTGCHLDVKAQFAKPFRHKIPENEMSCVDCHNPHGSGRQSMIQSFGVNEPGCFKCHGDKRGPFTFEHAPVRYEGCGACHEPHGSVNPRMLTRHEVRLTCLECHSNLPAVGAMATTIGNSRAGTVPPALHDLRLPRFQNCTVCHQKIHGSYTDRFMLR